MRLRVGWCWIAAAAVLWIGCRGLPHIAPLPEANEVPVQQLVFHTNFDLPSDHRLIRELTAERDDICETLDQPVSHEPIHVYLFRDATAFGQYLARQFPSVPSRRAFFLETDTRLEVYAHWSDRVAEDLRHEVGHGYLHSIVGDLPLWLDEGLAEYFEVPRGQGGLNRPHLDLLHDLVTHNHWQPDLERLEGLTAIAELTQSDYAEAWGWVYFMLKSDPARRQTLVDYLSDLREDGTAEPLSLRLADGDVDLRQALVEFLMSQESRDEGREPESRDRWSREGGEPE